MEILNAEGMVLANDPSMTAWGWAVINPADDSIYKAGCITTDPEAKMRRIRKGDDRVRRIDEIARRLKHIMDENNVSYIVAELPHGSQNAAAAVMIGAVTGVIQTIATIYDFPCEWYSENDSKRIVLNKKSATKQEMIDAIERLYDVKWDKAKKRNEAIADAIAVYHAARHESAAIKMFKRTLSL